MAPSKRAFDRPPKRGGTDEVAKELRTVTDSTRISKASCSKYSETDKSMNKMSPFPVSKVLKEDTGETLKAKSVFTDDVRAEVGTANWESEAANRKASCFSKNS